MLLTIIMYLFPFDKNLNDVTLLSLTAEVGGVLMNPNYVYFSNFQPAG